MYFITTLGHGRGGHFFDLATITKALSNNIECVIVNIGINSSPVINSLSVKIYDVIFHKKDIHSVLLRLYKIVINENPDILHSFDARFFFIPKLISWYFGKPLVLTKCGGPNPNGIYPYSENMIVFSQDNLNYFQNNKKYKKTKIFLLPNRVFKVESDINKINILKTLLGEQCPIFLRISRFSLAYKNTAMQSINLIKQLNKDGHQCKLLIVGVIEDRSTYNEISLLADDSVILVTDDLYTKNASTILDISDFVIGTGRGLMEAASIGKILLTPLINAKFPILVDQLNFDQLASQNFSPRCSVKYFNENDNYNNIISLMMHHDLRTKYKIFSINMFIKYFDVKSVVNEYVSIYKSLNGNEKFDCIGNVFNAIQAIRSWRNSSKILL